MDLEHCSPYGGNSLWGGGNSGKHLGAVEEGKSEKKYSGCICFTGNPVFMQRFRAGTGKSRRGNPGKKQGGKGSGRTAGGKRVLLWAPADILEYARAEDSSVTLLYGRNMWDKWLDAYSYDTYPETYEELYEWIENEEQFSRGKITEEDFQERKRAAGQNLTLTEAVERAAAAGVNCILLPESLDFEEISALAEKKGFEYKKLDGYHLLTL